MTKAVAIVGAGVAGLACGRELAQCGASVQIFEKSRGLGGRLATRRVDEIGGFDHGAQYFTVRDERMQKWLNIWSDAKCVAEWQGQMVVLDRGKVTPEAAGTRRFVGQPTMNALAHEMARDLVVKCNTVITRVEKRATDWCLATQDGLVYSGFDSLILTPPAPQTRKLLQGCPPGLFAQIEDVSFHSCWALLLSFATSLSLPFDGAFVHNSPLSWVARNSSKPLRGPVETWIAHGSPAWSAANLELDPSDACQRLVEAFEEATGVAKQELRYATAHRWRYSGPVEVLPQRYDYDDANQVGICGDWCGGPRVEGAVLSGDLLAQHLHAQWASKV